MNNIKKILFLIAALIIPSMVYVFLRGFGNNKFEIPVYYSEGITIEGCTSDIKKAHFVNFENYDLEGAQLFFFSQWIKSNEFLRQCKRIKTKPYHVAFTAISDTVMHNELGNTLVVKDEAQLFKIANCALVIGQDSAISIPLYNQLILVDADKRIRGYYDGNDIEDMDRLDIELDILSKESND